MSSVSSPQPATAVPQNGPIANDFTFAISILSILTVLFVPIPAIMIDLGLALSISISVLILIVALWIPRPLDFTSFPTVLLIATMLRLALNIASTRLILTDGVNGEHAAGHVIAGFSNFVMGGDFIIGFVIFMILVTVNFIVITKGASRIAEVGARFSLDGIPGKQMAIDADLGAGVIDEREAQRRRAELEEESAFFGSMDGASKFVRGDAIAGLIITAINIVGGILIGYWRHGMALADAVDVYTKLAVGDGLVSQIPALIISLAAGLVVAKGATRGSIQKTLFGQFSSHPRALTMTAFMMGALALVPGLPFLPFAVLAVAAASAGSIIYRDIARARAAADAQSLQVAARATQEARLSIKSELKVSEIDVIFGQQLAAMMLRRHDELSSRAGKLRRKFVREYGVIIPEIQVSDDSLLPPRSYQFRIHGAAVATQELRIGEVMVIVGDGPRPTCSGEETQEPAFGLRALWIGETYTKKLKSEGFTPIDPLTILLTHLSETLRSNLAQLFTYRDMQQMLDTLAPEYKKLLDDIRPQHISNSSLQAVLKLLLAERVSIRNLPRILEAVAEVAVQIKRPEQLVEHVRQRLAQQICGDLARDGSIGVVRLGARWDLAFHESLRRDARGEIVEFDMDPAKLEQFARDASRALQPLNDKGDSFVVVSSIETRPFVRLVMERLHPSVAVLSHAELARTQKVRALGSIG